MSDRTPTLADLQQLVDAVARFPDQLAGVSTKTLTTIAVHAVHGALPEPVADAIEVMRAAGARVGIVSAAYSMTELRAVEVRIPSSAAFARRNVLSSWGVDPATNRVEVGVTRISPELEAEVRNLFGDIVHLNVKSRFHRAGG